MKPLIVVLALAALTGCATQPAPYYAYNPRVTDPNGWQTVSVTPVPLGTGARVGANGEPATITSPTGTTSEVQAYAPAPATTTIVTQPVYVAPPVYAPAPVYAAPYPAYWWPPISIGLGFSWGHWSGGGHGWHGGGWHGGGWHGGGWHGGGFHHR